MTTTPRYEDATHTYWLNDQQVPSITQMLKLASNGDGQQFYTEESRIRGTAVHALAADYDLGALDVVSCISEYRGWLLGYVAAIQIIRPVWSMVETRLIHPVLKFGGCPDRVGIIYGTVGVLEIKTGNAASSHPLQTALQAILVADQLTLAPVHIQRFALYLKDGGKWSLTRHQDYRDIDEAYRIIKRFAA